MKLPQYDRRAVNVTVSLPRLHELLDLKRDLRITHVEYDANLQFVVLTLEGENLDTISAHDEPFHIQLQFMQRDS